jgi:hypothetical protein
MAKSPKFERSGILLPTNSPAPFPCPLVWTRRGRGPHQHLKFRSSHGRRAIRIRQPSHTHTAALPYAHGRRAIRARERRHIDTGGLPYAHGRAAVCAWRSCRMRMAPCRMHTGGRPYSHGRLPCSHGSLPYAHGWAPVFTRPAAVFAQGTFHNRTGRSGIRKEGATHSHGRAPNRCGKNPYARGERPILVGLLFGFLRPARRVA